MQAEASMPFEKVLVTGGAGFIGMHVVRELLGRGVRVRVFDTAAPPVDTAAPPMERVRGDVRETGEVRQAVAGCDAVVHLAARAHLWGPDRTAFETVNHQGTRRVLEAAAREGVRQVVHVSSEVVLVPSADRPINELTRTRLRDQAGPYTRSKWLAEEAAWEAAERGEPVTIVTPSVPVGPGDRNGLPMTRLIRHFLERPMPGTMGGTMHLIDVRDVAAGLVRALERGRRGHRYLLSAESWTIEQVLGRLAELTGRPAPRFRVPYALGLAFAAWEHFRARWLGGGPPLATVSGVRLAHRTGPMDASRSLRELGIDPRPVDEALARTVRWLEARGRDDTIAEFEDLSRGIHGDRS